MLIRSVAAIAARQTAVFALRHASLQRGDAFTSTWQGHSTAPGRGRPLAGGSRRMRLVTEELHRPRGARGPDRDGRRLGADRRRARPAPATGGIGGSVEQRLMLVLVR